MFGDAFVLHVTLRHIEPEVWRRITVPVSLRLSQLHDVLQGVMGWKNTHLHAFHVGDIRFGPFHPEDPDMLSTIDERAACLAAVTKVGASLLYVYDFGDGWEHEVRVESLVRRVGLHMTCKEGERACPPEDCGGPPGYEELCEIMRNPRHPEYAERARWLGRSFDPTKFSALAVNKKLATLSRRFAVGIAAVK